MHDLFRRFASWCAQALGSPWAFGAAVLSVVLWLVLGALVHYSSLAQIIATTATSLITYLMVYACRRAPGGLLAG